MAYKIGIIGFGKISRDQHAPAIAASPDFTLAAVSNIGGGSAPDGVPGFAGYDEMLKGVADLDAVSICTPPGPRRAIAAACLAAGKHVLLEKPPAGTVTEVTDIANRAQAAGKVAFATYHAQHNAAVKRAAEMLAGKTLKALRVTWKEDLRRWHPGQDWIMAAGGFGIFDPGINALSILTRILPQPVFISAAELFFPANRQAPIAANLTFSTGTDADEQLSAAFDWRQTGPQTWEIDVETSDGVEAQARQRRLAARHRRAAAIRRTSRRIPGHLPGVRAAAEIAPSSKVDAAPFQLVADAFMLGARTEVEAFQLLE